MVTYDSTDKVLFSADGFGKFGALDVEEDWDCEARRYYIGIVGKIRCTGSEASEKLPQLWISRQSVRFMVQSSQRTWDITLRNMISGPPTK